MARQNRGEIFDPLKVSVMHCINRAVRRAMLCGYDKYSGKSYEHRRGWIKDRLKHLAKHYGIDVLGYAIMANHFHCILRNRPDVVATWSDREVARRIWFLFPKRRNQDGTGRQPTDAELNSLMSDKGVLMEYRKRLSDISWLMRQVTEHVAVRANREEECGGRFWGGRFKSQPLLDEAAILACSAYVDLNPVRAAITQTPEKSDYTSVQDRIESFKGQSASTPKTRGKKDVAAAKAPDGWLAPVYLDEHQPPGPMPSHLGARASDKGFLQVSLVDYLKLIDWTGRQIVSGKRGRIPDKCKPILERLGVSHDVWCELVKDFGRLFGRVAGRPKSLGQSAKSSGRAYRRSHGGPALLAT